MYINLNKSNYKLSNITMKKLFLLLISACFITSIYSQEIYNVKKNENKFIYGQSIKLFMGDSILVEAKVGVNSLKDFKVVDKISDSSKTMVIRFTTEYFGGEKSSLLKISNPFERTLNYKAKIKLFKREGFSETSIVPILPGIFSMEIWPDKLESIVLYDFKLDKK